METYPFDYHKLENHNTNLLCIEIHKGIVSSKYEFGLGLSLDDNNIVKEINKGGQIYEYYPGVIKPGMKVVSINDKLVGYGEINTTRILRQQHTKTYNIYFSKPSLVI